MGVEWILGHSTTMGNTSERENNDFSFRLKLEFPAGP